MLASSPLALSRARTLAFAVLATLSFAAASEASCIATRPPERDLWIEVVSCSDQALEEVSSELFLQAVGRTDQDWTAGALPRATKLLRETPGVLIVAREQAFADSTQPFSRATAEGLFDTLYSDRPGVWQSSGIQPERRYYLGSAIATCEALLESRRHVVREVFNCCDTGRGPGLSCILQVSELVPSVKAPPTPEELSAAAEPKERPALR